MKASINKLNGWMLTYRTPLMIIGFILLIVYPFVIESDYIRSISTKIIMYVLIVSSLNVINGYSGQFTIGTAGFIALGAYTSSLLMTKQGVSFWIALIAAGVVAAIIALFISLTTKKLSGLYMALVTLGFSEIIRIILLNWTSVTNGPLGVKNIPPPSIFGYDLRSSYAMYFLILALTIIMIFCTKRVIHSKYGRAWISIRENENAAASLGIQTTKYKAINMMYGAFWAGIGGAFMAVYYRYIDSSMFNLDENFNILAMMIIGGMGTLVGPIAGVISVNIISEAFRFASEYRQVIYAIIIIGMMWIRPQGLVGSLEGGFTFSKKRKKKASVETQEKEGVS